MLDRYGMDTVVRNVPLAAHRPFVALDPAHAVKHLAHGNNLKVTAIAGDVDFGGRGHSSAHSEFHDFPWVLYSSTAKQPNILEQSRAVLNKLKDYADKSARVKCRMVLAPTYPA